MTRATSLKQVLIIEGNIGAGKSTFLRLLNERLHIDPVFEPASRWQHVGDGNENLLDKFYKDTTRWAYTFQTYAFVTRIVEQEERLKECLSGVQVLERSVYCDRHCFAKNCYEMGVMQPLEWQLYQEWFNWLVDGYTIKPTGFLYLQVDPEVCYDRLRKRNRSEEAGVPLDYLNRLHEKHEKWLVQKDDVTPILSDVPVLVLPCSNDFEHNEEELLKHVAAIAQRFNVEYKVNKARQTGEQLSV